MSSEESPPFGIIKDLLRDGEVVPFLGAAASFIGCNSDPKLPSGQELSRILATKANYPGSFSDPLGKIAQYVDEIASDRDYLIRLIHQQFYKNVAPDYETAFTSFLCNLPLEFWPTLILTTNYDVIIEKLVEKEQKKFLAISHIFPPSKWEGRFLIYDNLSNDIDESCIKTLKETDELLLEMTELDDTPLIIYKMHGTSKLNIKNDVVNSIVLTESDYTTFLGRDFLSKIPNYIIKNLLKCRLLFLGYSLEDWNFRILLEKIRHSQKKLTSKKHWACLLSDDQVEQKFWEARGVNIYNISLDTFLDNLLSEIKAG